MTTYIPHTTTYQLLQTCVTQAQKEKADPKTCARTSHEKTMYDSAKRASDFLMACGKVMDADRIPFHLPLDAQQLPAYVNHVLVGPMMKFSSYDCNGDPQTYSSDEHKSYCAAETLNHQLSASDYITNFFKARAASWLSAAFRPPWENLVSTIRAERLRNFGSALVDSGCQGTDCSKRVEAAIQQILAGSALYCIDDHPQSVSCRMIPASDQDIENVEDSPCKKAVQGYLASLRQFRADRVRRAKILFPDVYNATWEAKEEMAAAATAEEKAEAPKPVKQKSKKAVPAKQDTEVAAPAPVRLATPKKPAKPKARNPFDGISIIN